LSIYFVQRGDNFKFFFGGKFLTNFGRKKFLEKEKGEEGGNLLISEVGTIEIVPDIWKDFS